MPNRIIKESICMSEDIDDLSPDEEVFFYRVIVNCDDYGRMDARPQIVRAKCYPLKTDSIKLEDLEVMLITLSKKLITLYEVNNKRYLQVNTWEKHQNIRAKESKFPSIEDGNIICLHMNTSENICNQTYANVPVSRYSILDTRISNNMSAPNGADALDAPAEKSDNKGGAQKKVSGKGNYTEVFNTFWSIYPRSIEKMAAFKQWNARLKEKVRAEDLILAARAYASKCEKDKTEERFIKHASTFLGKDKPYEDYIKAEDGDNDGTNSANPEPKDSNFKKFDPSKFYTKV